VTPFQAPTWTLGTGLTFKTSASAVAGRHHRFSCPAKVSLGARYAVSSLQPNDATRWRRQWDDASSMHFAIRDAHALLADGIAVNDAAAATSRKLTAAQRRFLVHALHQLSDLADTASDDAGVSLTLEANVEYSGSWGEITVFGAHLLSADGTVREMVRLRLKDVRSGTDPEVAEFVAVAGWVLAKGVHPRHVAVEPARIRISEYSLDNGRYLVQFDGTPKQARENYLDRGGVVQLALEDQTLRPGSGCADCNFLNVCPAVPNLRGALGLPGRSVATRALTATDLGTYDRCPTAFHVLRRDHLPPAPPEEADAYGHEARDRGLAVHTWLSWAHDRDPHLACTPADLADPITEREAAIAAATASGLTMAAYSIAWPYLRNHIPLCLMGFEGLDGWVTEPVHVVYDTDADIVVVSSPDLTGRMDTTASLWRETKTSTVLPADVESALHRYPGFALDVALLAAGVDDNATGAGSAELEVLTPTAGEVFYVPLSDGTLVSEAQKIVARIGHAFSQDKVFGPRPSAACHSCDAYGWCLPKDVPDGPAPTIDDAEFAELPDPF
jgi:hypothetical protein